MTAPEPRCGDVPQPTPQHATRPLYCHAEPGHDVDAQTDDARWHRDAEWRWTDNVAWRDITPEPLTVEQATRDAIAQVQSVRLQLHQLAQIALAAADALAVLATAQEDQL